jgi:hypothetical protein
MQRTRHGTTTSEKAGTVLKTVYADALKGDAVKAVSRLGPEVHDWNPLGDAKVGAELKRNEVVADPVTSPSVVIVKVVLLVYTSVKVMRLKSPEEIMVISLVEAEEYVENTM